MRRICVLVGLLLGLSLALFLASCGEGDEWTTTESGLMYKDVTVGEGESPTLAQTVEVHYAGWIVDTVEADGGTRIDSTKFDSSYDRGTPAQFRVGGVIKGWTEALQTMKPGGLRWLIIPPELGYGARGAGASIPPNATLVFKVELISIK